LLTQKSVTIWQMLIQPSLPKCDDAFVATLPPLKPSAEYSGGGHLPKGWGWEIGNGGVSP